MTRSAELLAALQAIEHLARDMGGKTPAQRCALIAAKAHDAIARATGAQK